MVTGKYGLNIVHMCGKIWAGNTLHLLKKKRLCMLFFWVVTGKSRLLDE